MKIMRKSVSILLMIYMLIGITCISYANETVTPLPKKLLSLDISEYSKATTGSYGEDLSDSGITNTGTSTTANIDWISNDYQVTVKSSLENANNEITEYLDFTMKYSTYADKCWRRVVKDNIWETQANTISFWVDIGEHASYRNFLSYHAQYTDSYVRLGLWQTPNNLWNTDSNEINAIEVSKYTGWKYIVITNPLYDEETSKKTMDIYVNGVKKKSIERTKPSGDLEFAGLYFAGAPYPTSVTTPSMPLNCKYGDVAVYDDVLTENQIIELYADNRARFGIEAPNSVVSEPAVISPGAESFEVEMEKEIDVSEITELKILTEERTEIAVDYTASGSVITVKPKEYLCYGKEYVLDFPSLYSGDYTFTTKDSGVDLKSYSSVTDNAISFILDTEREEGSITVIAVGFDLSGELCGATSAVIDLASDKEGTLSETGMNTWNTIKLMVWENGDGYTMPLTEVIEIN